MVKKDPISTMKHLLWNGNEAHVKGSSWMISKCQWRTLCF